MPTRISVRPPSRTALRTWAFSALMAAAPLWALTRVAGLETDVLAYSPATQFLAFTPYAAALSPLPLALAFRRWLLATGTARRRPLALTALALLSTLTLGLCVVPRAFPDPHAADAATPGGPTLTVLTANLSLGVADPAALVDLVRTRHPDVLLLQEYTPEADAGLVRAGLSDLLRYRVTHPETLAAGSALYSRYPLTDPGQAKNRGGFHQVHATVTVPGGPPVELESVHTCSPFSLGQLHCWRTDLAREPHADAVDTPGALRILAGDFNATLDHAPLRTLIGHGYRDAADTVGAASATTWGPYGRHPFIPPVTVDHVLPDHRIGVVSVTAHGIPRTDHRALLAVLRLPGGS